jgi:CPA2 family monovalent cation:H+ antiporter-2
VLIASGLMRARALAITYSNTASALAILAHAQQLRPGLPVVVRTLDDTDIDRLKAAGAAEVVAEVMEGSLMLASSALMLLGVPLTRVLRRIRETREQRYQLFRGFFRGVTDEGEDREEALQQRLHSVALTQGSGAIGKRLDKLNLPSVDVEITAVRRRNVRTTTPAPDTVLEEGDVVVVLGTAEAVIAAEMKLMQG